MKPVANAILELNSDEISSLEKNGTMDIQGFPITLEEVEISTKDIPGWTVISDNKLTVALDLTLTEELKAEGVAREFVNRVQGIRKEKNFDLMDRILIEIEESCPYKKEILDNKNYISEEVLSDEIKVVFSLSIFENIEIDEVKFKINVNKI